MPHLRHAHWLLAFVLTLAQAQEGAPTGSFIQMPELMGPPVGDEDLEPEITIKETGRATIYEYRVRGVLYMVKVQPQFGPPYYFYDINGDGAIDAQERAASNIATPQWILFEWD